MRTIHDRVCVVIGSGLLSAALLSGNGWSYLEAAAPHPTTAPPACGAPETAGWECRSAGDATLPATMLEAIQQGPDGLQRIRDLAGSAPSAPSPPVTRRLDDVALLAPLSPPVGNVAAVGRNYGKHVEEANRATGRPASQSTVSFFTKAQTSVAGPVDDLRLDFTISDQMDWEVELGVVIGRTGINISEDRALEHVFGYTVVNDTSARDIQMNWGGQYFKGKSVDYSCPTGPWIVTKDELGDPQS